MTDKDKIRAAIEERISFLQYQPHKNTVLVELKSLLSFIDSLQETPDELTHSEVTKKSDQEKSTKKCMYSKDNFTDEDRKTLCDGCRESNCSFYLNEDLEVEFNRFLDEVEGVPRMWHSDEQTEWALNIARHFAEWQKEQMLRESKMSGWVARDKDGSLHIFEVKPRRSADGHQWWDRDYQSTALKSSDFPDLKWEDEPVCVKLAIIKED